MLVRQTAIAFALGASALTAPAAAQVNDDDYCIDYEYLYEDGGYFRDGMISRDEYASIGQDWFVNWDVNEDGYIEEDEFLVCYDAIGWDVGDSFRAMDYDGNSLLDEEEFLDERDYDRRDLDRDGNVTLDEWW